MKAHNTATASSNKIHDDAVARTLGFRGGLVPGVDVYAYLCHLPAQQWGRAWLERGTVTARFASPVYDGDQVEVAGEAGPENHLRLTLTDSSGTPCAIGRATLPDESPPPPAVSSWPAKAPPEAPPRATPAALTGSPLGSIASTFDAEQAVAYLDDIREGLPLFRNEDLAHPGWLLRRANSVLTANVVLGPWIHVESTVQFLGLVGHGNALETRAIVTDVSERGGHRFVDLDVLQLVGDRPVARIAHTAIFEPRATRTP